MPTEYSKTVRLGYSVDYLRQYYHSPRGINLQVVAVPDLDHASDQTICKYIVNALNPGFPKTKEDIDNELSKLKIIEDRVRSKRDWKVANKNSHIPGHTETIIDSVQSCVEDTWLDSQIHRASQVQDLPNNDKLVRLWGKPN